MSLRDHVFYELLIYKIKADKLNILNIIIIPVSVSCVLIFCKTPAAHYPLQKYAICVVVVIIIQLILI